MTLSWGLSILQGLDHFLNSRTVKEMKSKVPVVNEEGNIDKSPREKSMSFVFGYVTFKVLKFFL